MGSGFRGIYVTGELETANKRNNKELGKQKMGNNL